MSILGTSMPYLVLQMRKGDRDNLGIISHISPYKNIFYGPKFSSGLMALEHRWSKCMALEGNYIEKEEVDLNQKYVRLVTYRLALVRKIIFELSSILSLIWSSACLTMSAVL